MSRFIKHYGIKGQRHGIRRFQYADGTLTPAGKRRYRKDEKIARQIDRERSKYVDDKGKLTKDGKKKYGTKEQMMEEITNDVYDKRQKKKQDIADLSARELSNMQRMSEDNRRAQQKATNKAVEESVRERAKKMSDAELRDAVNRLNMEENYTRMMASREHIEVGRSSVDKYLDFATTAVSLTGSALGIALAIKELRG